ncbi:MAG: hypothetical protein AAF387_09815 [Pseudomonadota bacterium]
MKSFFSVCVLLLSFTVSAETVTSFTDDTFEDLDWLGTIVTTSQGFLAGAPEFEAGQEVSGGNLGAFRKSRNFGGGVAFSIAVGHLKTTATIDPTIDTIQSFDMFFDIIGLPQAGGTNGSSIYAPIIEQSGVYYGPSDIVFTTGTWSPAPFLNMAQDDLTNYGGGTMNPDFSPTGDIITFGYAVLTIDAAGGFDETTGLDNWAVDITTTPAPAIVPLPGALWGMLAAMPLLVRANRSKNTFNHKPST